MANRLRGLPIKKLYASNAKRAIETAEPIATATGLVIETVEWLREIDYGTFEGHSRNKLAEEFPEEYKKWQSLGSNYSIPGGDCLREYWNAVVSGLQQIATKNRGQMICAVAHAGVIDVMMRDIFGIAYTPVRAFELKNCSINIFSYSHNCWKLVSFGDTYHLEER